MDWLRNCFLFGALLVTLLVTAAPVSAARGLRTGFSDSAYDQMVSARADLARINVPWSSIAAERPAHARDPNDPAYNFSSPDKAVRAATDRGLDVLLTISAAPSFAEGNNRPSYAAAAPGSWRPDPAALGDFAAALATRYSGTFEDLPRVRFFQVWNEPNLSGNISPQYEGTTPYAAIHYRTMLNSFYNGVKSVSKTSKVVTAGTAPYGDPPGGLRTRPLTFWRQVLCLKGRSRLKAKKCPSKARFDILAHHPINTSGGPTRSAISPNDASTPDFKKLVAILRAAERQHTVGTSGRHPTWATEIWWDSNPPDTVEGVPAKTQARWLQQALYILWKQGASVVINLQAEDDLFDPQNPLRRDSTGVFFSDGTPKPSLTAWRFPFVTDRASKHRLIAWGKAPATGRLEIQARIKGNWRKVASLGVNQGAVFQKKLRRQVRGRFRATVAGETSLVWVQR